VSAITLEVIQAKQTELAKMIEQFQKPAPVVTYVEVEDITIELQPGERYAGIVVDEDGDPEHHLILMAQRPDKKFNWQAAMDWAASIGGSLPTRQEQALLFANCKAHLEGVYHWSSQTHEDDASFAWGCGFDSGGQGLTHESYDGAAVAVRRL
jgi:hypothetical protein